MANLDEIPLAEPWLGKRERQLLNQCLNEGWVSSAGKFIGEFERLFSSYCGVKYGVATSNGTSALHLALVSLNIGPEDEVIVPTLSFIATANVVTYAGAKPVFVDSDSATWALSPAAVESAVTKKTRAIIAVHLYGHPAEMDKILAVARKYNLAVIEDACEAHGAEFRGRKVGSLGTIGCFSFYGNKIITTGEGGMLVTDNLSVAENARMLRDHGMSRTMKYWHPRIGFNYRMTNLQAALGVAQLERIDQVIHLKRRNAELYRSFLQAVPGVVFPSEASWAKGVHWLHTILLKRAEFKVPRVIVMRELLKQGIHTRPVFYPISSMPPYRAGTNQRFPVAEMISRNGLSLPSSPLLRRDQIRRISNVIRELTKRSSKSVQVNGACARGAEHRQPSELVAKQAEI
jgi:perosamine synthetase